MAEGNKEKGEHGVNSRVRSSKEEMMRDPLQGSDDDLRGFTTPEPLRRWSPALAGEASTFEYRASELSAKELSDAPEDNSPLQKKQQNVHRRRMLITDFKSFIARTTKSLDDLSNATTPEERKRSPYSQEYKAIEKMRDGAAREESILLSLKKRVENEMDLSQSEGKGTLGATYLHAIAYLLPEPAGAVFKKKDTRERSKEQLFRQLLISTYHSRDRTGLSDDGAFLHLWCPVTCAAVPAQDVKAAHIVPCSLGPATIGNLLGDKPSDGIDLLWSAKNGLLLHKAVEGWLDDGRLVIVPDPDNSAEYISIVLCEELRKSNTPFAPSGIAPCHIHNKRLTFDTSARPGKRFLYLHAMLTLSRRRLFGVPGWQHDGKQVFNGNIWASPGFRRSGHNSLNTIAAEFGDRWSV